MKSSTGYARQDQGNSMTPTHEKTVGSAIFMHRAIVATARRATPAAPSRGVSSHRSGAPRENQIRQGNCKIDP
jgi:hypothetical protein